MRSCNYFFVNALFQSSNFTEEPTTPSKLYEEYEKIYQLVRYAISTAMNFFKSKKFFKALDITRRNIPTKCPQFEAPQMKIVTMRIVNFYSSWNFSVWLLVIWIL